MFAGSGLSLLLFVGIVLLVAAIALAGLLIWQRPISFAIKDPDALTEIVLIALLITGVFALALFIIYVFLG